MMRPRRRSALDFSRAQTGDVATGSVAGRDTHNGIPPEEALNLVRYLWDDRQQRAVRQAVLDKRFDELRDTIELYRVATVQRLDRVDRWMRRLAYFHILLGIGWLLGFIVLTWLLVDRYAFSMFIRVLAGSVATLTIWKVVRW